MLRERRRWWPLMVLAMAFAVTVLAVAGSEVLAQQPEVETGQGTAEQVLEDGLGEAPQPRASIDDDLRLDDVDSTESSLFLRNPGTTQDWQLEGGIEPGWLRILDPDFQIRANFAWDNGSNAKGIELIARDGGTITLNGAEVRSTGTFRVQPGSGSATVQLVHQPTGYTWEINTAENDFVVKDVNLGNRALVVQNGAPDLSINVDGSGRVGFGTVSPAEELHIATSQSPRIRLEDTGGTTTGNQTWTIGMNTAGDLFIKDDANVQMRIFFDGRIRYNPVATAPSGSNNLGDLYNDTSGALCWYDGSTWVKVVGTGTCT